jgi:hypothetical protein
VPTVTAPLHASLYLLVIEINTRGERVMNWTHKILTLALAAALLLPGALATLNQAVQIVA